VQVIEGWSHPRKEDGPDSSEGEEFKGKVLALCVLFDLMSCS
jgi:hypothetical protein